jgi:hypothetical protein
LSTSTTWLGPRSPRTIAEAEGELNSVVRLTRVPGPGLTPLDRPEAGSAPQAEQPSRTGGLLPVSQVLSVKRCPTGAKQTTEGRASA